MLWKGFQKPKRLAADTDTLTDKYGKFYAQPFERGFGTTIGNALRRVLLSSIEGAAAWRKPGLIASRAEMRREIRAPSMSWQAPPVGLSRLL